MTSILTYRKIKWQLKLLIALVIVLLLILFGFVFVQIWPDLSRYGPVQEPRVITHTSVFEPLWSKSINSLTTDIYGRRVNWSPRPIYRIFMIVEENSVILPVHNLFKPEQQSLISYDLQSGNPIWVNNIDPGGDYLNWGLIFNTQSTFVLSTDFSNSSRISIMAIDHATGKQNWVREFENFERFDGYFANEESVVFCGAKFKVYTCDVIGLEATTGAVIPNAELPRVELPPTPLYAKVAQGLGYNKILAGTQHEDTIFVLVNDTEASLMAIDVPTKAIIGEVIFDNSHFTQDNFGHMSYALEYTNNYVALYLGDSQQLFGFEFIPPPDD